MPAKTQSRLDYELRVENFGKLAEAEIRIGGFTVLAGPNNTGKSFVSKLLCSIFNADRAEGHRPRRDVLHRRTRSAPASSVAGRRGRRTVPARSRRRSGAGGAQNWRHGGATNLGNGARIASTGPSPGRSDGHPGRAPPKIRRTPWRHGQNVRWGRIVAKSPFWRSLAACASNQARAHWGR